MYNVSNQSNKEALMEQVDKSHTYGNTINNEGKATSKITY